MGAKATVVADAGSKLPDDGPWSCAGEDGRVVGKLNSDIVGWLTDGSVSQELEEDLGIRGKRGSSRRNGSWASSWSEGTGEEGYWYCSGSAGTGGATSSVEEAMPNQYVFLVMGSVAVEPTSRLRSRAEELCEDGSAERTEKAKEETELCLELR